MVDSGPERHYAILIAEDEPGIREALELLLQLEGYEVTAAANGAQALEALARERYDLILTDHMMPVMDGLTFLGRVRADERFSHVPAIMMSAVPRPQVCQPPLAQEFVSKPFEIDALLAVIRRLMSR